MEFVFCHRDPKRSFFFKGRQFPLCARCTGLYIGYSMWPLFVFDILKFDIIFTISIILPTFIDGFIQYYFKWESKNWVRLISGLIAGTGLMSLAAIIGKFFAQYFKSLF
jgi:uncharacterized membrane protein